MLVNLSLSGIAFCGADVGGFLENATGELFARWFQFAAFTPFFRSHTNIGTARQEPWSFGPEIEGICRQYLELRARWMPWWYSLIAEAHRSGSPLLRPMLWLDPSDEIAVRCGDQFLVGDGVLVAPILRQGARARCVYLPAGRWYDFWTGDAFEGRQFILREAPLQRIPLLIRAGTILPTGPVTQHTLESAPQTVDLDVWLGGEGSFTWQEDDGKEVHTTPANSWRRRIRLIRSEDGHLLEFAAPEGGFKSNVRAWRLLLHGMGSRPRVFMNGQDARVRLNAAQRAYEVHVPNDVRRLEIEIRV
jgi:alpha-glucosidase